MDLIDQNFGASEIPGVTAWWECLSEWGRVVWWVGGGGKEGSVGEWDDFALNALFYLKPVKWAKCRCNVVKFVFRCDWSGHVVLDDLEFGDVVCWKVEVEWVAVGTLEMNQGWCNGADSFKVKISMDTPEVTQVVLACEWESRYMLVKSEVVVNEKANVVSMCRRCYNSIFVDDKLWTVDSSKLFR
jgi:hypothetical protein